MRIAVCDDDAKYVDIIKEKLDSLENENIEMTVDCFTNQEKLIKRNLRERYNLIYLDIEMDGKDGIEVARKIKEHSPLCIIIFVTNYADYVSNAFRVEAFQYLSKPIDDRIFKDEFKRAVKKYKSTNKVKLFKMKEGVRSFNLDELITVESYYNSTTLKTVRGVFYTNYANLRKIRKVILDYDFIQLQAGYIVNMHYISTIRYREAQLITGQIVPVSMKYYTQVLDKYFRFVEGAE